MIDKVFPTFSEEGKERITELIRCWMLFTVKLDSSVRILNILHHTQVVGQNDDFETDKVALFREFESPRDKIEKKIYWVCFEAEMKIQIWLSQFKTYESMF